MNSKPTTPPSPLACRMLRYLVDNLHTAEGSAVADHRIAEALQCAEREVTNLADELLAHGHHVCANTRGRFIVLRGDDLKPVYRYRDWLTDRVKHQIPRLRAVKRNLHSAELSRRPAASDGQLNLPIPLATDPRRFTE